MSKENTFTKSVGAPTKTSKKSKLYKTIIESIENKKGYDITILDLRKIEEAIADFFILCTVDSHIQAKAIKSEIERQVKTECKERPLSVDGESKQGWIVMDFFNITVHIFEPDQRALYRLEELWSDAD